ncbi:hypothetical protein [Streptomyces sp. STCH 565 A]|uniref:hypothetical protein n=1 Tax=Streptomyces sp. STCH 565 A TaxID=2950532 RepID=UPI002074E94A|nr:hypothetical protein [Streptomyces sp. STCH 565 A]MCM8551602.1 hypothetical protein [Streptomyces sp. STCH 565 A]
MTVLPLDGESDAVRREIIAAINRLLAGTPHRSNGRLNVTQLAVEADVKRWHLTHQHTDLKDQFQAEVARAEAKRAAAVEQADEYAELKRENAELRKHCRHLEARLEIYATALNQLALENAALSARDADAAKVRTLPRSRRLP